MAGRATRTRKPEQQLNHQRPFSFFPAFRSSTRKSFTIIEMLVVMFVIMIMCGIVIGSVGYVTRRAAEAKSAALLAKISMAIESYKADWGNYPLYDLAASKNWSRDMAQTAYNFYLTTNLAGLNGGKKYLEWATDETNSAVFGVITNFYVMDGFGNPIAYYTTTEADPGLNHHFNTNPKGQFPNGLVNFTSYDLWSFGADGQSTNTIPSTAADDIKNW